MGEGGMNVTVHNHTQLDGAFIDSKADAENNRFKTKSIGYSNIENHSEIKTESASVSAGTGGMNPMQAISSALSLLGNGNESATSQTKAAIGQNIQIETDTPENLKGLSRDVANANQQVQKQSLEKMQERQEMAKVVGELTDSGLRRLTEEPLKEANAKRQQAEAIAKENPAQAEVLKAEAKAIEAEYGLGSDLQMGVRAATAALQGLATNDINQALVGAASPYLNQEIKKRTTNADGTVNTQANLIAHALLGAAEAKVTGNHALAGATAAVTAEAAAPYIMQALYQTDNPAELNEAQKRNVANLSQIAAGLSGGLVGDSTQDTVAGAEIGKRAVENNGLLDSQVTDLFKKLEKSEKEGANLEEIYNEAKQLSDKQYADIKGNCVDSAICRYGAEKLNEDANQRALELVSYFNSKLSSLSEEEQIRFVEFVIQENGKEFDLIEQNRTPAEKFVVKLVDLYAESAQERGRKLSPKIASFAKKAKNPNIVNKDWKYIPAPKKEEITGFKDLIKVKDKTSVQGGGKLRSRWKDREGNIYEWDSQHGTMEKYNKRGKHLGEFDFKTGKQTKSADLTRSVEP